MAETKVCSKCKIEKELTEFYKDKRKKDGLQTHCQWCHDQYYQAEMEQILHHYGAKCNCNCGCKTNNLKLLTIDHVHNDGATHRKELGGNKQFYKWLRKNNYPNGFQILCYNCNCGKYRNNGVCPLKQI